jgi:hypothetical protein
VRYKITNTTAAPVTELTIGEAVDFDVTAASAIRGVQARREYDDLGFPMRAAPQNTGHINTDLNLIYQQGVDSTGHVIVGDNTATRFKAGITAIQRDPAPRAWIAPSDPMLFDWNGMGFQDGYLYHEMTKSGFELLPPQDPDPEEDLHSVMIAAQGLDLAPGESEYFQFGLISSNTGTDETDLINTTRKAWRYAFGWQEIVYEDTVPLDTPMSYPYRALGVHEAGVDSPCSGYIVDKVWGSSHLTIVPGPDPCSGTIEFTPTPCYCAPIQAVFRVRDSCLTYEDLAVVEISYNIICDCFGCGFQSDYDEDTFVTALDLGALIAVLFEGKPEVQDPGCISTRGDFDCDFSVTPLDLTGLIDYLYQSGPGPCDPCEIGCD